MLAGKGERLQPLTLTTPKPLIPIGGRSLIDHMLQSIKDVGIDEARLVVWYMADEIKEYLGKSKCGIKLSYSVQDAVSGTARAVKAVEKYVGAEPFLVIYGDLFVRSDAIKNAISDFEKRGALCMAVVPVERGAAYGMVKMRGNKVANIVEKPKREKVGLANAGIYVLDRRIFNAIEKTKKSPRGEFELTDSVQRLIDQEIEVRGVPISEESWVDVGRPWDLLDANRMALLGIEANVKGKVEEGARLIGPVGVAKEAKIMSGAYVEGPAYIGKGSKIGPNCYIRPYTSIGDGVRIGNACDIKNSIIMDGTHIAHLSYFGDSIVGKGCNIGAGTIVANLRFDDKPVKMTIKGRVVSTGRRKFGVVIGDNVKTGVNSSLLPGVKVGPSSWIGAGMTVNKDVPANTLTFERHRLREKKVQKR